MTTSDEILVLPSDMRAGASGTLFDTMKASRGQPMSLDASAVERMDTLAAQLFAMLAKCWAMDQLKFKIFNPSERVVTTMTRLGMAEYIQLEGTANDD